MHWRLRRAGVETDVEADATLRQQRRVAKRQMMLGRADRTAVERGEDRAAIVAVGPDIEDQHEAEHSERQVAKSIVLEWQRQATRHPAKPGGCGQRRITPNEYIVDRACTA